MIQLIVKQILNILGTIINEELIQVDTWFKHKKWSENKTKTKFMVFRTSKSRVNIECMQIKLNNKVNERVENIKLMGIHLDEYLNFKKQWFFFFFLPANYLNVLGYLLNYNITSLWRLP